MSLHAINQKPLGALQREVLMLAEHGDVGVLRGASAQRKALVSKGMITADRNEVTDLGALQLAYEHARQAPLPFIEVAMMIGNDFYRPAHKSTFAWRGPYGTLSWVGAHSADGKTAYITRRSSGKGNHSGTTYAVIASTIPSEHRAFFQLKEL